LNSASKTETQTNTRKERKMKSALVLVVSGPSGVGKSVVVKRLREEIGCRVSVSATTRKPRLNDGVMEVDGVDYHFIARREFEKRIAAGKFLEWEEVHGHYYGTPIDPVHAAIVGNSVILLVIDVKGHASIRKCKDEFITDCLKSVFLKPPTMKDLRHRLLNRGGIDHQTAERRLIRAKEEMKHADEYDYVVKTKNKEYTFKQFVRIIMENIH